MKTVNDILKNNTVHHLSISGDALVIDALALMKSENRDFVIVLESGNYIGVMSEKDYSHKIILEGKNSHHTTVKEIMTGQLPIVDSGDTIHRCMGLMHTFKTHYLPVVEEFLFKGIITLDDLLRASVEEDTERISELKKQSSEDHHFLQIKPSQKVSQLSKFK